MKVTIVPSGCKKSMSDLENGDVFEFDGRYYIRAVDEFRPSTEDAYYAFSLKDADLHEFAHTIHVRVFDAELTLKEKSG